MDLHFFTKDFSEDYPNIGWISRLPNRADSLWRQFGNIHAAQYPEIILSASQGRWTLYLSAIHSGRLDYMDAIIRVSFVITGSAGEYDGILSLLDVYLHQILPKNSPNNELTRVLNECINKGDPVRWKDESITFQQKKTEELLKALVGCSEKKVQPCDGNEQCNYNMRRWYGGCRSKDAISSFLLNCEKLMNGSMEGLACSLSNLRPDAVSQAVQLAGNPENMAILLSSASDQTIPITNFIARTETEKATSAQESKRVKKNTIGFLTTGIILRYLGLILLLFQIPLNFLMNIGWKANLVTFVIAGILILIPSIRDVLNEKKR